VCPWGALAQVGDNIKMDLKEAMCESAEWNQMAQGRDQWWAFVCIHGNKPSDSVRGREFLEPMSCFSFSESVNIYSDRVCRRLTR